MAIIDANIAPQNIAIADSELNVEWYSGTGSGGQFRNKHQNSCRLTHIKTGIMVTSQTRSRTNSYALAYAELTNRVKSQQQTKYNNIVATDRKQQVGSGMRGDKIRTYRFQEDAVKDHLTDKSASLRKVMNGDFAMLWPK